MISGIECDICFGTREFSLLSDSLETDIRARKKPSATQSIFILSKHVWSFLFLRSLCCFHYLSVLCHLRTQARWVNSLDPRLRHGAWALEEDLRLTAAFHVCVRGGGTWRTAAQFVPGYVLAAVAGGQ